MMRLGSMMERCYQYFFAPPDDDYEELWRELVRSSQRTVSSQPASGNSLARVLISQVLDRSSFNPRATKARPDKQDSSDSKE
jgi:hypothetical protein